MSGKRVVAGFHAVTACLRHAPESIEALYADGARRDGRMQQLLDRARAAGVRVTVTDAERLQGMAAGSTHQGVRFTALPLKIRGGTGSPVRAVAVFE